MLLSILTNVAIAAEEAAPGFTMAEIWEHSGGIARTVIVMLVVMMLASIVVSIERAWMFHKAKEASIALVGSIVEPLQAGDIKASLALCNAEEHSISYIATLLRAGLKELDERSSGYSVPLLVSSTHSRAWRLVVAASLGSLLVSLRRSSQPV
jgi:hypothetical protein